jgi:hypothetical protein
LKGRSWPNLPQISLQPGKKYRLEGWFKLSAWTAEELAAEQAKDKAQRENLKKKGQPLPPEIDWAQLKPSGYIVGDFYEWSPHTGPMLVKQCTSKATRSDGVWEHVKLDFESPIWGPFINIVFMVEQGTAWFDDFALRPLD